MALHQYDNDPAAIVARADQCLVVEDGAVALPDRPARKIEHDDAEPL
jgi:hypothetical protein